MIRHGSNLSQRLERPICVFQAGSLVALNAHETGACCTMRTATHRLRFAAHHWDHGIYRLIYPIAMMHVCGPPGQSAKLGSPPRDPKSGA